MGVGSPLGGEGSECQGEPPSLDAQVEVQECNIAVQYCGPGESEKLSSTEAREHLFMTLSTFPCAHANILNGFDALMHDVAFTFFLLIIE